MELELGRAEIERLLTLERKFAKEGLTFGDVLLVPAESDVLPGEVSTRTRFARGIEIEIPIVSAAMDTVTEARMAIALAREGGIGVVHRNLPVTDQVAEVDKVKRSEAGMIVEPVTLRPDALVSEALELMAHYHISGVPITDEDGKLVGILTNRDLRFQDDVGRPVSTLMTSEGLVTVPVGTNLEQARETLHRHKVEKLPVVDSDGMLRGLITVKDIQKRVQFPDATKDERGRLRVAAAVGVGAEGLERAEALLASDVDVLVVDTSHGHSIGVIETIRELKGRTDLPVVGGNVATREGAEALVDAGADAIKVGMGPGAICTTRVVAGIGVPQITAVYDCAQVAAKHDVPLIADGGIQYSGRHCEGAGRRRGLRHARGAPGRRRREPGRRRPSPGRAVQGVPGDGLPRSHEVALVLEGQVLPGRRRRGREARSRGDRGASELQGTAPAGSPPTGRRSAPGDGLLRRRDRR